jgi:hypothetical protein
MKKIKRKRGEVKIKIGPRSQVQGLRGKEKTLGKLWKAATVLTRVSGVTEVPS